ncbi:MAG: MarR family winged helix-turn-helix transcriptional regulator [Thermomicrobiales bacterium]
MSPIEMDFADEDYRTIAEFRAGLRRFMRFSEEAALAVGLTPQQHQLLLAVRGFPAAGTPTIGDLANALQIRHHSAVGLVNRLEDNGFVRREGSTIERRKVHVHLTDEGAKVLRSLIDAHRREYRLLVESVQPLLDSVAGRQSG